MKPRLEEDQRHTLQFQIPKHQKTPLRFCRRTSQHAKHDFRIHFVLVTDHVQSIKETYGAKLGLM